MQGGLSGFSWAFGKGIYRNRGPIANAFVSDEMWGRVEFQRGLKGWRIDRREEKVPAKAGKFRRR
jgi:hypothetical protein